MISNETKEILSRIIETGDPELIKEALKLVENNNSPVIIEAASESKGGQNPNNTSKNRPPPPQGSGGDEFADFRMPLRSEKAARKRADGGTYTKAENFDPSNINQQFQTDNDDDYYAIRPNEKKMYKNITSRDRDTNLVEVRCSSCGKTELVAPILATASFYRCNKCLTNRK